MESTTATDPFDSKKMSGQTADIQKMLRSKPAEEEFERVRRAFRRKTNRRDKSNRDKVANARDLCGMVASNHAMYKQVLQQKIAVEEINKAKSVVNVEEKHKINKSFTFAMSPRFDANAMTIRI